MYRMNFYESVCLRCNQTVYQVDRVGPLKDFTFYHSGCFKCAYCGTKLTLKTYYNNQHDQEDKEVYCSSHVPKIGPGHLDGSAVGIRSALNVPRSTNFVNEQIRGSGKGTFDAEALNIRPHLNGNSPNHTSNQHHNHSSSTGSSAPGHNYHHEHGYQYGRFDASALHIAHALRATELHKSYNKAREKPIEYYLEYCCEFKRLLKPEFSSSFFSMDDWDPSYINDGACKNLEKEPKKCSRVKFATPLVKGFEPLSRQYSEQSIEGLEKSSGDNITDTERISRLNSGNRNLVRRYINRGDLTKNNMNQHFLDVNKYERKPIDSLSNLSEVQKNFENVMLKKVKRYMPEMDTQEIQEKLLRSKKPPEFYLETENIVVPVSEELRSYGVNSVMSYPKNDSIHLNSKTTSEIPCSDYNNQNPPTLNIKNGTFDDDIAEVDQKMTWILNASSKMLESLKWKYG